MTDNNQIIKMWVPMSNPSERFQDEDSQYTRDWIASHNCKVIEIDETPNPSQPDVLLEGTIKNLRALVTSKEYGFPINEANEWVDRVVAKLS